MSERVKNREDRRHTFQRVVSMLDAIGFVPDRPIRPDRDAYLMRRRMANGHEIVASIYRQRRMDCREPCWVLAMDNGESYDKHGSCPVRTDEAGWRFNEYAADLRAWLEAACHTLATPEAIDASNHFRPVEIDAALVRDAKLQLVEAARVLLVHETKQIMEAAGFQRERNPHMWQWKRAEANGGNTVAWMVTCTLQVFVPYGHKYIVRRVLAAHLHDGDRLYYSLPEYRRRLLKILRLIQTRWGMTRSPILGLFCDRHPAFTLESV